MAGNSGTRIYAYKRSSCRITARQTRAMRAEKALVSLTAFKRLQSSNDLKVFEPAYDQVRRTRERSGIVFLTTDRGEGVMIVHTERDRTRPT